MGVLARFIDKAPLASNPEAAAQLSANVLTPATALTATRPALAAKAARMLLRGERYVTPVVAAMAASDMEGVVARFVDKRWPEWGRGTTRFGVAADKYADVAGVLLVAGAALRAPNVSRSGKLAVAGIIGQESLKVAWAVSAGVQYKQAAGQNLDLPPSALGKEAMAEKFVGVCAAVATNDTDSDILRTAFGATALAFAGNGALRGESARRDYAEQLNAMMAGIQATEMT